MATAFNAGAPLQLDLQAAGIGQRQVGALDGLHVAGLDLGAEVHAGAQRHALAFDDQAALLEAQRGHEEELLFAGEQIIDEAKILFGRAP